MDIPKKICYYQIRQPAVFWLGCFSSDKRERESHPNDVILNVQTYAAVRLHYQPCCFNTMPNCGGNKGRETEVLTDTV
jgi:hypothetical protein